MKNETEFQCYSVPLYFFLMSKKMKPLKVGINQRTGNPYAIYKESEELHQALVEWAETKISK